MNKRKGQTRLINQKIVVTRAGQLTPVKSDLSQKKVKLRPVSRLGNRKVVADCEKSRN
jgi:hypothetical protein